MKGSCIVMNKNIILAVDFDGTIALGDSFPNSSNAVPNTVLLDCLRELHELGCKIVLWTCREDYGGRDYPDHPYLTDAVNFCLQHNVPIDSVNKNIGENDGEYGTQYGRKIRADVYIDDKTFLGEPNWEGFVIKLKKYVLNLLTINGNNTILKSVRG